MLLPGEFFSRPALEVSRELLGQFLCRELADRTVVRDLITEVEAYIGPHDLACHAAKGRTKRTEVMFGPGGHWYVYLCYGIHEMLNVVTDGVGYPSAVLIRGVATVVGPGRLTKRLRIDRRLNGLPAQPASGLWVEASGLRLTGRDYETTPRIGIDYAGPVWSKKPYRFVADASRLQKLLSQVRSA